MLYPLKGRGISGRGVEFSLEDIPKKYDATHLYLASRPNTELILTNTVGRGSDIMTAEGLRVFEGDILRNTLGKLFYVSYDQGFKFSNANRNYVTLSEMGEFFHLANTGEYTIASNIAIKVKRDVYSSMRYRSKQTKLRFRLYDLVAAKDGNVFVKLGKESIPVPITDIQQYTDIRGLNKEWFYFGNGDYKDFTVCLLNGEVVFKNNEETISALFKEKLRTLVK